MRKRVKLTPSQEKVIRKKLIEAKRKRLLKDAVFDKNATASDKLKVVRTIIKMK